MSNHTSFGFVLIYGVKYICYSLSIYKSDHLCGENLLYLCFHLPYAEKATKSSLHLAS